MRIAIIASARFPISQPFAGGLESQTWSLADGLRRRGHEVTLFAESSGDSGNPITEVRSHWPVISDAARSDPSMSSRSFLEEHHAYLHVMLELAETAPARFDVIHNNSLHHLPVAMAPAVSVPVVTTLHTPPTPWLESAIQLRPCPVTFVAVSEFTARSWSHVVPRAVTIPNGVDLERWQVGPGGGPAVWFGRLVPEKGAELAIRAAKLAGLSLDVIGPRPQPRYFDEVIAPLLDDKIRFLGHLRHDDLADVVGRASACLITPRWDEPYGLVAAEALACGTPVAAFARGGLPEVVSADTAVLVPADDVPALARAAVATSALSRRRARAWAQQHCSVEQMLNRYEALYAALARRVAA